MSHHRFCCCGGDCCDGHRRCRVPATGVRLVIGATINAMVVWHGGASESTAAYRFLVPFAAVERSVQGATAGASCDGPYEFQSESLIGLVANVGVGAPPSPTGAGFTPIPPGFMPGQRPSGLGELTNETLDFRELILTVTSFYLPSNGSTMSHVRLVLGGANVPFGQRLIVEHFWASNGDNASIESFTVDGDELVAPSIQFAAIGPSACEPGRQAQILTSQHVTDFLDGEVRLGTTTALRARIGGPSECPQFDPQPPSSQACCDPAYCSWAPPPGGCSYLFLIARGRIAGQCACPGAGSYRYRFTYSSYRVGPFNYCALDGQGAPPCFSNERYGGQCQYSEGPCPGGSGGSSYSAYCGPPQHTVDECDGLIHFGPLAGSHSLFGGSTTFQFETACGTQTNTYLWSFTGVGPCSAPEVDV